MASERRREDGFTLVELLVVIVILGILAAIGIPKYLSQRQKAWRGSAVGSMKNAAIAMETWATENNGVYAGLDGETESSPVLADEGFNPTDGVTFVIVASASSFCIRGSHDQLAGREFVFRSGTGVIDIGAPGVLPC